MKKVNHIHDAAVAFSDLNAFAIVVSILEGGHVHSKSYKAAQRIIDICKGETAKRLRDYDGAAARSQSDAAAWRDPTPGPQSDGGTEHGK